MNAFSKKRPFYLVLWSLALLLLAPLGCGPSQQQLEKAIGDYIQKNPQALQKSIQAAIQANRPQRPPDLPVEERIKRAIQVPIGNSPIRGAENATVTIVEFSDFQCPFCKRVTPTLDQILKDYNGKVRLVFRNNPLPFHPNAMPAAKASLAAKEQGKFWEMHDALFANQQDWTQAGEPGILKVAKDIGLNMSKFEKDWKSDKFDAEIQEDIKFAAANGASGTPSFFINGVALKGAQPITGFKEIIDKLLNPNAPPSVPAPAAPPAAGNVPVQPPVQAANPTNPAPKD